MGMLSGFISQVHRIIGKKYAECKCYSKKDTIEAILQSYEHRHATCKSAMKRRESSGSEYVSGIDAFVSDDIYDNLGKLDNTSDDDHEKNRIHMKSSWKKSF